MIETASCFLHGDYDPAGGCPKCGAGRGSDTTGAAARNSRPTLVGALVKLRQRIDGEEIRISQAEAQALYMGVLRHATAEHLSDQEYAEQIEHRLRVVAINESRQA